MQKHIQKQKQQKTNAIVKTNCQHAISHMLIPNSALSFAGILEPVDVDGRPRCLGVGANPDDAPPDWDYHRYRARRALVLDPCCHELFCC